MDAIRRHSRTVALLLLLALNPWIAAVALMVWAGSRLVGSLRWSRT